MILYWYMHWFWITLLPSGFAVAILTQPAGANDSLVPVVLKPTGKSLSPNVGSRNLIHPNRTVTAIATSNTLNANDTKIRSTSSTPTTLTTTPTALSTVMDELDGFKKNDIFIQSRINGAELDKPTLVDSLSPHNHSSNIIAMEYTNNSFEENINNTIANMNDTEMLETTHSQVLPLNISQSSVANSNLIDNSGGNIGPTEGQLTAAGITGITVGCVGVVGLLSAVSFLLYRYRTFNRPEALNDYCSNLDSSGYIDDTSIRDNSEEMYSLDNDSFLNSLEAMTIQNYWTDKVKHTKL